MTSKLSILGWREWLTLSDLGIPNIKAKVDTGARTSALHTWDLEVNDGIATFKVNPDHSHRDHIIQCSAPVSDQREVKDSGGHVELRPFIRTEAILGDTTWTIELSLTNRDNMLFPMLLGREAMRGKFLVNPSQSFKQSKRPS